MTFRPAPLRAAAILAAVFIGARVVYRFLFDGMDAGGPVLLPLPSFRLPEPFAHVVLLGPVTTGGLWDAVASAIPIAAIILAFGVLNSLVDVSRGFAALARHGPFRGVARMLAIAWATLPALADSVRSVRFAFRLRGERFGARALVPVLERTLERASAIAAALELRGLGATVRHAVDPDCEHPVVVRDAVFSYGPRGLTRHEPVSASAPRWLIRHEPAPPPPERDGRTGDAVPVGVAVAGFAPGTATLTVITGATGAGKSTVLRGLAGLLSHVDGGSLDGLVDIAGLDRAQLPPRETARFVGVALQNPREAFATECVRDEIGLALELRGVASVIVAARVREVAERIGIERLLDRPVRGLSAGEATLVAIAAAVVEHPILLLVDEPLADLDTEARAHVVQVLDALAHDAGVCVVVAEHRAHAFAPVADAWFAIAEGVFQPATGPASSVTGSAPDASRSDAPAPAASRALAPGPPPALTARAVSVRRGDATLVRSADLDLHPGEIVALVGPNGAGKSSLLAALTLPERGADVTPAGRVALVPDASDDLFTRDTVAAELRAADRRSTGASARFSAYLGRDEVSVAALRPRHPRDLSLGERRCLALALQSAGDPAVLMVDEPTRGLDAAARGLVARALRTAADTGTAVIVATHDAAFAAALGARILPMRDGVAPAELPPRLGSQGEAESPLVERARNERAETPQADLTTSPRFDSLRSLNDPRVEAEIPLVERGRNDRAETPQADSETPPRFDSLSRHRAGRILPVAALAAANLVALAAFCWPLLATALPDDAQAAAPFAAMALAPLAAIAVAASLDGTVRSAHTIALLGVLAAVGAAVRMASTGVGGVEAVFILLILAGRAYGARFGLLLGVATIAISSVLWGGIGPWTPFQMFACAWVGAGAGLLPRRVRGWAEVWMLCAYGVVASYLFGLLMNLWFWPFAVGAGTGISYTPGGPLGQNLASFLVYSLITSTASWDTLRAITTVVGIVLVGRAVLAALRRAKPVAAPASPARTTIQDMRPTDRISGVSSRIS
ncbi:ATP-binding cassette domain-containing protein [Microbacterium sp. ASV49]|uniref:ATP-binding cassette domain-containing protein n=1 Tax=Microbacterium candidum TaxID=3041922 RepID=A0ABT7N4F7_9MICO|nr:ATP-binding cassette domain-containing protein [Microbacterium sp. ASV49]MDL9981599.1 ATP-binding cassette domain-containing protein [Microbacterium sp. ASV49]